MDLSRKIVVVDDEAIMRDFVVDCLLSSDTAPQQNIQVAQNGRQGLELCQQVKPDLVITDIMMPEMNGAEMIHALRQSGVSSEIIVMSGYADLEMAMQIIREGVGELLRKPFKPAEIITAVQKIFHHLDLRHENEEFKKKLVQAEKLSAIGILAAGIAHEINNPNAFVKGNLEIIQKYWDIILPYLKPLIESTLPPDPKLTLATDSFKEALQTAIEGSERIRLIVGSMLSISRMSQSKKIKIQLAELIQTVMNFTTSRTKGMTIVKNFSPTLHPIMANHEELMQVFLNLVTNALDALADKFTHKADAKLTLSIQDNEPKKEQVVTVSDNGPGISEIHLKHVFDPFFTTKDVGKGTGLGLYIARKNIESMGGSINVNALPGEGTTFTITLPWGESFSS